MGGDRKLPTFDAIKPGARLRRLDSAGATQVVQVAQFSADALTLVFSMWRSGSMSTCANAWSTGEDPRSSSSIPTPHRLMTPIAASCAWRQPSTAPCWPTFSTFISPSAPPRSRPFPTTPAVYREVLPRQPLRFLSADDRGAGKTIKACLRNRERLNRRKAARWISRGCAQIRAIARWRGAALATRNIPDFEGAGAAVINPWNVP